MDERGLVNTSFLVIGIIVLVASLTFAISDWITSKNKIIPINILDLKGNNITVSQTGVIGNIKDVIIKPTTTANEGIIKSFSVTSSETNKNIKANFTIKINNIQSVNSSSIKWQLQKEDSIINNGDFNNKSNKDIITLVKNIEITSLTSTYTLLIWNISNTEIKDLDLTLYINRIN